MKFFRVFVYFFCLKLNSQTKQFIIHFLFQYDWTEKEKHNVEEKQRKTTVTTTFRLLVCILSVAFSKWRFWSNYFCSCRGMCYLIPLLISPVQHIFRVQQKFQDKEQIPLGLYIIFVLLTVRKLCMYASLMQHNKSKKPRWMSLFLCMCQKAWIKKPYEWKGRQAA